MIVNIFNRIVLFVFFIVLSFLQVASELFGEASSVGDGSPAPHDNADPSSLVSAPALDSQNAFASRAKIISPPRPVPSIQHSANDVALEANGKIDDHVVAHDEIL